MVDRPADGWLDTLLDDARFKRRRGIGTRGSLTISVMRPMLLALAVCAAALAPAHNARAEAAKQASIIVDANTGKVLHAQSADELRFPASLTKMMTLYMLFGEIEAGRISYDTKIKFSERATQVAPSKLGLDAGDEIEAIDAIKALVVKSANDVAVAVAEHIGGTEYQFARMMTDRAHEIGMASTTFRNASGLPNPSQKTTARDMVTLGLRLQDDFPQHYRLFSTASFTFRGKTHKSHNTLMRGFPGMDGIKTGYTRASGFNLVSSVHAEGKHIVGAVFGGKTAATRNALMRSLLYTALEKASTERTRQGGPQLVARARTTKTPQFAQADAGWTSKTKKAAAEKPAKAPAKVAAATPPPPTPAVRPPQAQAKRDAIADVLAEGDASPTGGASNAAYQAAAEPVAAHPRLDLQALREAMTDAPPAGGEPTGTLGSPASGPQDIAGLIRHSIVEGTGEAPAHARPVADEGPSGPAIARPPGTLDSQAGALAFVSPAQAGSPALSVPPSHLKGPIPPSQPQFRAAPLGAGYEIQIGAYGTAQEAQAKLDGVRGRAVGLLEGHGAVTLPVLRENRQIFRARFVHFDEAAASNACLELRRLAIDCFVMKAD